MRFTLLASLILLTSCAEFMEVPTVTKRAKKKTQKKNSDNTEQTQGSLSNLGTPSIGYQKQAETDQYAIGKAPVEAAGYLPTEVGDDVKIQGYTLPSDDTIVWSDESKPSAALGFDKAFKKATKPKSLWHASYKSAKRESLRTGKPLMIWFTREGDPPSLRCKSLKTDLYSRPDFKSWASENVVRLKVDLNGGGNAVNNQLDNNTTVRRNIAKKLKEKYRVLGLPTVIIESPSDGVMDQYRGYKTGSANQYWGNLKDNILTHEHNYKIWRSKMAKKGYREWKGKNNITLFARLARYQSGNLILIEPDGNKLKTTESQLSSKDRAWIAAAKARRQR